MKLDKTIATKFSVVFAWAGIFFSCVLTVSGQKLFMKEVPREMFSWKQGFQYETELNCAVVAKNLTFTGNATGHDIRGGAGSNIAYVCCLKYTTIPFSNSTPVRGTALRHYETCYLSNFPSDITFEFRVGAGEKLLINGKKIVKGTRQVVGTVYQKANNLLGGSATNTPEKDNLPYEFRYATNSAWFGGETIVMGLKPGVAAGEGLEYFPAVEFLKEVQDRNFLLHWDDPTANETETLRIECADSDGNPLPAKSPPQVLIELINRESGMLYKSISDNEERKSGDTWRIDGNHLAGLIHPMLSNYFRGHVIVRAEKGGYGTPDPARFAPDALLQPYEISRILFVAQGYVDNQLERSSLVLDTPTVGGGTRTIGVDFNNQNVSGDIYVDIDVPMVRQAYLRINDASYRGKIPSFGNISVNAIVNGGIDVKMQYDIIPIPVQNASH